jgi:AcrR family transcriptional regulator
MTQWQGENNFALFKSTAPISDSQIWSAFYQLHKQKISVQKEKIAVEKLKTIIIATFKLSNKKGFSLMSLRDLSQETGMSMGSLYAYIGSKGQLAEMIHQFLPHMFELCIVAQIKTSDSVQLKLSKIVRGHIFVTECLQAWFFFAFMETKHLSRSVKQLAKDNELGSERMLQEIIIEGEKQNLFVSSDHFMTTMLIKNLLQSWYVKHARFKQHKMNCEGYIDFIEQVIKQQLSSDSRLNSINATV